MEAYGRLRRVYDPPPVGVSVVIPTWNGRALLDVALESLERQSLAPLEVIVVDNGSTDGTPEHLHERWPRVEVLVSAGERRLRGGVNRGLERARGQFIALINNDIELHSDCLRELATGLEARLGRRLGRIEDAALRRPQRDRCHR